MRYQESLLPGTQALTRGSVEISRRAGKLLVRFRNLVGASWQKTFEDRDEATEYFWACAERLKAERQELMSG